jgi:hypothetical protein
VDLKLLGIIFKVEFIEECLFYIFGSRKVARPQRAGNIRKMETQNKSTNIIEGIAFFRTLLLPQ